MERGRSTFSWQISQNFEVVVLMIFLVCLARFGNSSRIWKSMGSSIAEAKDCIETSSIRAA